MMIDLQLIVKLEELARLEMTDEERTTLLKDLQEMINMVGKLEELDLSEVEPLMHMTEVSNVLREDKVGDHLELDQVFKNAPEHDGTFFRVPKVIDRKEK